MISNRNVILVKCVADETFHVSSFKLASSPGEGHGHSDARCSRRESYVAGPIRDTTAYHAGATTVDVALDKADGCCLHVRRACNGMSSSCQSALAWRGNISWR